MDAKSIGEFILAILQFGGAIMGFTAAFYGYRAIRDWRAEAIGKRKIEIIESLWSHASQLVSWMQAMRSERAGSENNRVLEEINFHTAKHADQLTTQLECLKLYSDKVNIQLLSEWVKVILDLRNRLQAAREKRDHSSHEYNALVRRGADQADSISNELDEALEHIRLVCTDCISHPKQVRKVCFPMLAKSENKDSGMPQRASHF